MKPHCWAPFYRFLMLPGWKWPHSYRHTKENLSVVFNCTHIISHKSCSFYWNHASHFPLLHKCLLSQIKTRLTHLRSRRELSFRHTLYNTLEEPVWPNLFSWCNSAPPQLLVSQKWRPQCPRYYQGRLRDPAVALFSTFYQQCWTRQTLQEARVVTVHISFGEKWPLIRCSEENGIFFFFLNKIKTVWLGILSSPKTSVQQPAGTNPLQALLLTRRLTWSLSRWRWPFTLWWPSFSLFGSSFPVWLLSPQQWQFLRWIRMWDV